MICLRPDCFSTSSLVQRGPVLLEATIRLDRFAGTNATDRYIRGDSCVKPSAICAAPRGRAAFTALGTVGHYFRA
jgi:hypothetical protein